MFCLGEHQGMSCFIDMLTVDTRYLQFMFNLSLILVFLYLLVQFIFTVQRDVEQRIGEYSMGTPSLLSPLRNQRRIVPANYSISRHPPGNNNLQPVIQTKPLRDLTHPRHAAPMRNLGDMHEPRSERRGPSTRRS